jgi:hypothetical protein
MNGGGQSSVYTSLDPHLQRLARTRKFTNETSQIYEARNSLIALCSRFLNRFRLALNLRNYPAVLCERESVLRRGCVSTHWS